MSKPRRLIALALVAAAVCALVVAQAFAGTTIWKGNGIDDPQMTVRFEKVKHPGEPAKIREFEVQNMFFDCQGNPDFRSGLILHGTISKVHNGQFSYAATYYNSDHTIKYNTSVAGEFVSPIKVKGTVKQKRTVVSNPDIYCVSAREPWKALKQ
jgi:hypothetical protein